MNEHEQALVERGNRQAREYNGEFEYWTQEEALAKLKGCSERLIDNETAWGTFKSTEIEFEGKWYRLGNTDLLDDIRTCGFVSMLPVHSDTAQVNRTAYYGARRTNDGIYLINSLSDG